MRLSAALDPRRILLDLQAEVKPEALEELIGVAVTAPGITATPQELLRLVLKREALTSTAVAPGVAIPHARSPRVEGVVVSLGIHRTGLDFDGTGGARVHLVFLVLSSVEATPAYLSVLGRTARIFRQPEVVHGVLDAPDADAILRHIAAYEPA